METIKRLLMTFKTNNDKKVSISIDNPRTDLDEDEIKTAMDVILASDIFVPDGSSLVELVGAKIVQTDTTGYDLVI
jgi:LEA14-like dessication related protein